MFKRWYFDSEYIDQLIITDQLIKLTSVMSKAFTDMENGVIKMAFLSMMFKHLTILIGSIWKSSCWVCNLPI